MKTMMLSLLVLLISGAYAGDPSKSNKKKSPTVEKDPPVLKAIHGHPKLLGGNSQGIVIRCEGDPSHVCVYLVKSKSYSDYETEHMWAPCADPVPVIYPDQFKEGSNYVGYRNAEGGITYTEVNKMDVECSEQGVSVTVEPAIEFPVTAPEGE